MAKGKSKKQNDVVDWTGRLERAMKARSEVESQWAITSEQYEDTLYNNRTDANKNTKIRVNLAFPTIKVLLRAACSSDPFIYITGVNPQDEQSGMILQYLENRLWRIQRRKKAIRQIVLDTLILKVGYGLTHIKKDLVTGIPEVVLTRVSPYLLWIEPGASSVNNAYHIFRGVIIPRVEAEARWPGVPFTVYDPNNKSQGSIPSAPTRYGNGLDSTDRVLIYEVHDQLNREISYITRDSKKFLVEPKPNPYPVDTLFTELIFNEIIDEHYGLSDLEPVAMQQDEMDRVRSAMLTHTKRFNRKYLMQTEEYNKEKSLKSLESGEDGVVVPVDDLDSIKALEDAGISGDLYNYATLIRGDHREVTGINEYMNAGRISGTKTAYETEQIMAGARVRLGEKPDLVGDFCEEVANKDINVMKRLYPVPQIAQFLGPQGEAIWRYIQKWELQGEHYVAVQAGSTQPRDETANFQRGIMLYQLFGQDPQINQQELRREVLTLMNVRSKSRLLNLPPDMGETVNDMQGGDEGGPQAIPYGMNPQSREMPQYNALRSSLGGGGNTQL